MRGGRERRTITDLQILFSIVDILSTDYTVKQTLYCLNVRTSAFSSFSILEHFNNVQHVIHILVG